MDVSLSLLLLITAACWQAGALCPGKCACNVDNLGRRTLHCHEGELTDLAALVRSDGRKDHEVIRITSREDNPNRLELGPLFQPYRFLKELRITHSGIPIIGSRTFLRMFQLRVLDLGHNRLERLAAESFRGLPALEELLLDGNRIVSVPSGTFASLGRLRVLSLADNALPGLSPRMLSGLRNLETLDVSGNDVRHLDPDVFEDVRRLRVLRCRRCRLTEVNQTAPPRRGETDARMLFRVISRLEEVDFRDNSIAFLIPDQFGDLPRLRVLRLDGNRIASVPGRAFVDHTFHVLGLGRNAVRHLSPYAFYGITVAELDLSFNALPLLDRDALKGIAPDVLSLDAGGNPFGEDQGPGDALALFRRVRILSLADSRLDFLEASLFEPLTALHTLNLSGNRLSALPEGLLASLPNLRFLDLSRNSFRSLDEGTLRYLSDVSVVHLQKNPWACDECHVFPLLRWLRRYERYSRSCEPETPGGLCLKCSTPYSHLGTAIQRLEDSQVAPCSAPEEPLVSGIASRPNSLIGVVSACCVVLVLCFLVVLLVCLHGHRSAHYYTHEDKRIGDPRFPLVAPEHRKAAIATIEELSKDDCLFGDEPKEPQAEPSHLALDRGRDSLLNGCAFVR